METVMTKAFAKKWTKALRSGKYKQTVGQLKKEINGETCYCGLGVACVVLDIPISKSGEDCIGKDGSPCGYSELKKYMPGSLVDEIYELNDRERLTLPQIADWIDANVEVVEP